ncbi:Cobalamin-independent synthase-like protein [Elsinoe fawcettii]|nr:Cobalamin-independent synthase-like protein [Elsinoe fawcettii]
MAPLPFHAEHIGSLLRPDDLQIAKQAYKEGKLSEADLTTAEQKAVKYIVSKQQSLGIRPLVSGEYDRAVYFSGFFEKLAGFKEVGEDAPWDIYRLSAPPIKALKDAGLKYPMAAVCTGKIKYEKSPYLDKWLYLRSLLPESQWGEAKFTMPPACYFHLRLAPGSIYPTDVYDDEGYFADLAKAYQQEFKTLHSHGLKSVQIDDPTLAYFCSSAMTESLKNDGVDPDKLFELYLKAHNQCLEGRPEGLHVGLHICRGNFSKSMHFSEGSYEAIAEKFFKTLNYDTFYLEYDTDRAGGFEPLRFLPKGKNVVLGVVSTKVPQLEDPAKMKEKVLKAADVIAQGQGISREEALQSIGISPQCGFASTGVGNKDVTEDDMFRKLKLVKDVANEIWPDRP